MDRIELLRSYLEEDPSDAFTRFALATEYRKEGDLDRAVSCFETLVREQPDYVGTYYHLGKLYLEMNRHDEALQTFRSGIAVAAQQVDHHARAELQDALLAAEGLGDESW